MSNSKLVDYTKLSPYCTKPRKNEIDTITIHHMAGDFSVETCGNIFQKSRASANYGIDSDGRVGMYVEEENRSWCSSSAANDNRAITIEVANCSTGGDWPVSDKALAKLIDLCVDICQRNGIEKLNFTGDKSGNLTMHKWFVATACPGPYLESKFPEIARQVNRRLSGEEEYTLEQFIRDVQAATGSEEDGIAGPETIGNTVTVSARKNREHKVVKPIQKRLYALGYTQVGKADGIAGPKFEAAVIAFQEHNDCWVDGEITAKNKTWRKLLEME